MAFGLLDLDGEGAVLLMWPHGLVPSDVYGILGLGLYLLRFSLLAGRKLSLACLFFFSRFTAESSRLRLGIVSCQVSKRARTL